MAFQIVLLDAKKHKRDRFDCGVESLNRYLTKYANQDLKRKAATVFVLIDSPANNVIAYYTLSAFTLEVSELEPKIAKKLPRYPLLPAAMLGRLAVDKNYRGQKSGKLMLVDALKRAYLATQQVASTAVIVDAINDNAVSFYEKYGFMSFKSNPNRLYLIMSTIAKMFV
ncbi:MAG: GNAT family N-acetyltransferase [Cyanobacteria bacterium J06621_8]